jgi:hypothetical protein
MHRDKCQTAVRVPKEDVGSSLTDLLEPSTFEFRENLTRRVWHRR